MTLEDGQRVVIRRATPSDLFDEISRLTKRNAALEARVAELEAVLEGARGLIVKHHDVTAMRKLASGGLCPVCVHDGEEDAALTAIAKALSGSSDLVPVPRERLREIQYQGYPHGISDTLYCVGCGVEQGKPCTPDCWLGKVKEKA